MFSNEKGVTAVQVSELTRHAEKPVSGEPQNESFGVKICQANKTILVARVVRKKKWDLLVLQRREYYAGLPNNSSATTNDIKVT